MAEGDVADGSDPEWVANFSDWAKNFRPGQTPTPAEPTPEETPRAEAPPVEPKRAEAPRPTPPQTEPPRPEPPRPEPPRPEPPRPETAPAQVTPAEPVPDEAESVQLALAVTLSRAVDRLMDRCAAIEGRLNAEVVAPEGLEALGQKLEAALWDLRQHVELLAGPRADIQSLRGEVADLRAELRDYFTAPGEGPPPAL